MSLSLELGKIIQKACSNIVFAHKSNPNKVIKMYKFYETFETLNHFRREIDAYIRMANLHGLLVPQIFGVSWRHFLGFITMKALGQSIDVGDLDKSLCQKNNEGSSEPGSSFNFWFIDFGKSVYPCDEIGLEHERKEFHNFLNDYI